ncbi:MAG: hypothetical protein JEZ00_17780 [Anaerolineaceae bacterium]|nr:hypothetical protein [Anaerolineaceae bacterium]
MKKRNMKVILLLLLWVTGIACAVSNPLAPSATQTPYVITATSNTGELGIAQPTETPVDAAQNEPTAEQPQPVATATQSTGSVHVNQVPYGPAGLLVYADVDGMVSVFDVSGTQLGDIATPGFSGFGPGRIFAYGLDVNNVSSLQTIYFDSIGQMMKRVENGQMTDLANISYLANMQGFANSPYFLIGKGNFVDGGLATELMAYDFSNGVNSQLYGNTVSAASHVYAPMMIHGNNGVPAGAYYTTEAFGIGGDIVYPVTFGLYHLDLASGNVNWLFNDDYSPLSISPDGTLAAIIQRDASWLGGVTIYDLSGPSEIVTYDLLMGQDRGAGYGVISPDNQKVAFMQAGGHMMAEPPDFHSMLCYADIAAGAVANCLPATQLVVSTVSYPNSTAQPLGWLNNHELLYEAYTLQEPTHTLRVLDVDNGQITDLCSGRFLGFVY